MNQTYNAYYPMVPFTFDEVRQGEGDYPQDGWNSDIFIGRFVLWIKNSEGENSGVGKILRKIAPQIIIEENGARYTKNFEFIGDIGTIDPHNTDVNLHLQWTELSQEET